MRKTRSFLVIAADPERLQLISNTLHRKFPNSVVHTCRESDAALAVVHAQPLDAIVAHRSTDLDEIPLLEQLRARTAVPILGVSGSRDELTVLAAGAAGYLRTDQWLLIGPTVATLIDARPE